MKLIVHDVRHPVCHIIHIPLVDKSLQFNLCGIHNIPLVHPVPNKSSINSIQEEYLTVKSDTQYISFPLSADIMAYQVSNGQFCNMNCPLYTADTLSSDSYTPFLHNKDGINKFCILSVINQTQGEAININDNF